MKIFIPGRLCLFGEHSDWAAQYRQRNPEIKKGYALIVGTNQGIYAKAKVNSQDLIFSGTLNDGSRCEAIKLPMEQSVLLEEAQKGGFGSYIAGTAYQMLIKYGVKGLEIDNYWTDLPLKKGLSSSAAICVLIARTFNHLYKLHLTPIQEMELAYLGERTTPSLCGRMDQACAFGNKPSLMIFDEKGVEIEVLKVATPLYLVIVDLGGTKNTQKILRDLNGCYPFATNQIQEDVQHYLGEINAEFTHLAAGAVEQGKAEVLGSLMEQVQAQFDRYVRPACPEQLRAPKLHRLLNHRALKPWIFGGKGVGSQGDETAQLVARDAQSQEKIISIIHRDFPEMCGLKLTIEASSTERIS